MSQSFIFHDKDPTGIFPLNQVTVKDTKGRKMTSKELIESLTNYKSQVQRLTEENDILKRENKDLKLQVKALDQQLKNSRIAEKVRDRMEADSINNQPSDELTQRRKANLGKF